MRLTVLCAIAFIASGLPLWAEDTAVVRAADGFQLPVGPNGTGVGYYIARGYRPNGHLGEDWNGLGGGDTDLGDPVYAIANGYVTFARNYHVGWGNVVIIRHAYYEGSELKYCDSLYGHVLNFLVQEGEQVHRGQLIAHIGNNFGMYEAHLHLELRKNLQIGMFRSSFLRDFSNYYTPNEFIAEHRACPHPNSMVKIPINTYPPVAPPVVAGPHLESPIIALPHNGSPPTFARVNPLPPQGSGSGSAAVPGPKIVTEVPAPAPSVVTHEAKTANSRAVAAAVTPAPTPTVKIPKTSAVAAALAQVTATPPTSASRTHKKTVAGAPTPGGESNAPKISLKDNIFENASATPAPVAKHFKTGESRISADSAAAGASTPEPADTSSKKPATSPTVATALPPPTATPSDKHAKSMASAASTPEPTGKPAKKPTSSTAVAAASPAPTPTAATHHSKTIASTTTPTPSPKKGAKTPSPVAAAPTPTPTLAANKKTHKPGSPTPGPQTTAGADSQVYTAEPILTPPPAPEVTPVSHSSSGFRVDRFEDLRGKGY